MSRPALLAMVLALLASAGARAQAPPVADDAPPAPLLAASDEHLWLVHRDAEGALVVHLPLLAADVVASPTARLAAPPRLVAAAGDRLWLVFAGDDGRAPALYAQRVRRHPLHDRWFGVPAGALALVHVLEPGDEVGALAAAGDRAFVVVRRAGGAVLVSVDADGRAAPTVALPPTVPASGELFVLDADAEPPTLLLVPPEVERPAVRLPSGAPDAGVHDGAAEGSRVRRAGRRLVRLRPLDGGVVPELLGTGVTTLPPIAAPAERIVATARSLIAATWTVEPAARGSDAGRAPAVVLERVPLDLGPRVVRTVPIATNALAPRFGFPALLLVFATACLVVASARHPAIERRDVPSDLVRATPGDRLVALVIDMLPPLALSWGVLGVDPIALALGAAVSEAELVRALVGWGIAALACGLQTAVLGRSMGQRALGLVVVGRDPARPSRRVARGVARALLVALPPLALLALVHPRLLAIDDLAGRSVVARAPRGSDPA